MKTSTDSYSLRDGEDWESFSVRKYYYQCAIGVIVLFVAGLFIVQTFKAPHYDLSTHFFKEMSIEDRQRLSPYDWSLVRMVDITLRNTNSGMMTVRAANGEILFLTYTENGIDEDITVQVPEELKVIYIEHNGGIEKFNVEEVEDIAFVQ